MKEQIKKPDNLKVQNKIVEIYQISKNNTHTWTKRS